MVVLIRGGIAPLTDRGAGGQEAKPEFAEIDAQPDERLGRSPAQLEIVDPHTLSAVDTIDGSALAVIAVWFGEVRLIDNRLLG